MLRDLSRKSDTLGVPIDQSGKRNARPAKIAQFRLQLLNKTNKLCGLIFIGNNVRRDCACDSAGFIYRNRMKP